jgi:hypothetical protein
MFQIRRLLFFIYVLYNFLFLTLLFIRSGKPSISESWADKVAWNKGCLLLRLAFVPIDGNVA